jgi:uncharacterized protein
MAKRPKRLKHPLSRTIMWRLVNEPGTEIVDVAGVPGEGWRFRGHVHLLDDGRPVRLAYLVICDEDWTTLYADVELSRGPGQGRFVQFLVSDENGWQRREAPSRKAAPPLPFEPVPGLEDAIDVDLEFSPLTNTLPIRRLAPRIGAAIEPTAAWVRFPSLTVEPLRQRYTHLGPSRYRYESQTGYVAEVEVDDLGFVTRYGDVWERVADADGLPGTA